MDLIKLIDSQFNLVDVFALTPSEMKRRLSAKPRRDEVFALAFALFTLGGLAVIQYTGHFITYYDLSRANYRDYSRGICADHPWACHSTVAYRWNRDSDCFDKISAWHDSSLRVITALGYGLDKQIEDTLHSICIFCSFPFSLSGMALSTG